MGCWRGTGGEKTALPLCHGLAIRVGGSGVGGLRGFCGGRPLYVYVVRLRGWRLELGGGSWWWRRTRIKVDDGAFRDGEAVKIC